MYKQEEVKKNHQGLEYVLVRKLRFERSQVEVKFLLTGSVQIITLSEYNNGKFDDAVVAKIQETVDWKNTSPKKEEAPKKAPVKKSTKKATAKTEEASE